MRRLIYVTAFICLSFSLAMHTASNTLVAQRVIGEQSLMRYLHSKIYGAFGSFLADGLRVNYLELIQKNPLLTLTLVAEEGEYDDLTKARSRATSDDEAIDGATDILAVLDELSPLVVAINILVEESLTRVR